MNDDFEKLTTILSEVIGSGELILRNINQQGASTEFLVWIKKVKQIIENLISDKFFMYEINQKIGNDIAEVNSITGKELAPKLNRMLYSLREIKKMSEEKTNKEKMIKPLSKKNDKVLITTFDEYTLGNQIGQGGSGEVFVAKNTDGDIFAIKLLRKGLSQEKIKRFKNEIMFCQNSKHINIIKIIDHGILETGSKKQPFYVMPKYLNTYRECINAEKDPTKIFNYIILILNGIEAAHLRNCYHRDLKPENILIGNDPSDLVISDFGIAHFEEEDLATKVETLHHDRLANFMYAAPEQRKKGANVDHRSDIYAIGLMINESFTKQVPHGTDFLKISDVVPQYGYLDDLVDKMIKQTPDVRLQTIESIKSEIFKLGKIALSKQKIDEISKQVINVDDISTNPFVQEPIKIIEVDHTGEALVCRLNKSVPNNWIEIFHSAGASSFTTMHHHKMLNIFGNTMTMKTPIQHGHQAKQLIDEWIKGTNYAYKVHLEKTAKADALKEQNRLEEEAKLEMQRKEFLSKINI